MNEYCKSSKFWLMTSASVIALGIITAPFSTTFDGSGKLGLASSKAYADDGGGGDGGDGGGEGGEGSDDGGQADSHDGSGPDDSGSPHD